MTESIGLSPELTRQEKPTMTNQLDLSHLDKKQLKDLIWTLRGTPEVQAVYRELSSRPSRCSIKPDDPEWEAKTRAFLKGEQKEPA